MTASPTTHRSLSTGRSSDKVRTALVTGATSGIGQAVARRLAADGWRILVAGRRQERLDALVAALPPEACTPLCFDIQDTAARGAALETILAIAPALDLLVNNAGLALGTAAAHRVDPADWHTMIATNVVGLVAITHALLPALIARRGVIVNLSSVAGTYPYPGGNVYGATKAFVRQFSLGLHCDLVGTGVRVTSLEPGIVETEFTGIRRRDAAAGQAFYAGANALQPDDMARMVAWIAEQPEHVNINAIEIMPTSQTWAGFDIDRTPSGQFGKTY